MTMSLPENPSKEQAYDYLVNDLATWASTFIASECYHPDGYQEDDQLRAAEVLGLTPQEFFDAASVWTYIETKDGLCTKPVSS